MGVLARLRLPSSASSRALAAAGTSHFAPFSSTSTAFSDPKTVSGLNTKKSGGGPELKEDSAYPEWLWGLSKRGVSLYELGKQDEEDLEFPQVDYHKQSDLIMLMSILACIVDSIVLSCSLRESSNLRIVRTSRRKMHPRLRDDLA